MKVELRKLPSPAKVSIIAFCLYCVAGPVVSFLYHITKVGAGFENMLLHYYGNPEEFIPPKGPAFFLEVMHFHTWSQAVVLFCLSFLFSLTHLPLKTPLIVLLFLSSAGHILFPSLTRFVSRLFVYPLFISTVVLSALLIFMATSVIFETVRKR